MVALQIREVPEDVRETLAERARARGQSLQSFLLSVVTEEAARSRNASLLDRFAHRSDGTRTASKDAAEPVRRARAERDAEARGWTGGDA